MPVLTIDNRKVEVEAGATILDAADKLGIEIPTMCFLKGYEPATSCMICIVQVEGLANFVPACATIAEEGMIIRSSSEQINQAREKQGLAEFQKAEEAGAFTDRNWKSGESSIDNKEIVSVMSVAGLEKLYDVGDWNDADEKWLKDLIEKKKAIQTKIDEDRVSKSVSKAIEKPITGKDELEEAKALNAYEDNSGF